MNQMTRRTLTERLKLVPDVTMHKLLKEAITMEKAEQVEATPAPTVPAVAPVREEGMEKQLTCIETA